IWRWTPRGCGACSRRTGSTCTITGPPWRPGSGQPWPSWGSIRSARADRGGGAADDEFGGEFDVVGVEPLPRRQPERAPQGDAAHLAERLADGGEGRGGHACYLGVVEADHAEVLRHAQAAGPGRLHHAERGLVAAGEDRGRGLGQGEEGGACLDAVAVAEAAVLDVLGAHH